MFVLQNHKVIIIGGPLDIFDLLFLFLINVHDDLLELQLLLVAHLDDQAFVVLDKHFVQFFKNELLNLIIRVKLFYVGFKRFIMLLFQLLRSVIFDFYVARVESFAEHDFDGVQMLL